MDQHDSRGDTGLGALLGGQKSTSSMPSSGSLPLPTLAATQRPATQHSAPQQLIDQRRHTVDFSAWSSMGKTCDRLPAGPSSKNLSHLMMTTFASDASPASNATRNIRLTWNDNPNHGAHDSLERKGSSRDPCLPITSDRSFPSSLGRLQPASSLFGENEIDMARLFPSDTAMHRQSTEGFAGGVSDMFGRRASLSQLSVFGGVWDQPDPVSLHKHSNSLEMGSFNDAFIFPAAAADTSKKTNDCVDLVSSLYDNPETDQKEASGTEQDQSMPITASMSLSVIQDKLNCLASEDSYSQQVPVHLQRQFPNTQQHYQPPPQSLSSRRNSRIHPNPIQPPAVSHAKKASIDEPAFNGQQLGQGPIQHGGFVPGFDIWSNREDRQLLDPNGGVRHDILSQRRKSESVLHDLTDFSCVTFNSIYQSNTSSVANPSFSVVSASSTRSASPLDANNTYQQSTSEFFGEGPSLNMRSGPLPSEPHLHPLSPLDQDINSGRGQFNSLQTGLHPHFANASDPASVSRHGSSSNSHEMCGLCSVQRATVSMDGCGHRVCNVCHRHEKHRSMRLFQNEIPPCPFCARGVVPTLCTTPASDNRSSAQAGVDAVKQYPLPQMNQLSYANQQSQQQQQRYTPQKQSLQSSGQEEICDRYPHNRQYHYTFPGYGATPTVMRLRSSSTQLDNAPPLHSSGNGAAGATGGLFNHSSQNSYHKPPQGSFPMQATAVNSSNQRHLLHFQNQQHPSQSSGLNHHAPNFQPANSIPLSATQQEYPNLSAMGRPGMVSPPTCMWREGGAASASSDYGAQDLQYSQQHYPSQTQLTHMQQRRGSQHHIFHSPNSAGGHHQAHSYYGGVNGVDSNINGVSVNMSLSFSILPNLPPAVPPTSSTTEAIQWAVVRVTNIPWDVSLQDMHSFFSGFPYPPEHLLSQNVHILMDRATGKTFNSAFIELALTPHQAGMVASARNLKVLKGRLVTVELSSQDELLRAVFPKWTGQFLQGDPVIPGEQQQKNRGNPRSEEEWNNSLSSGLNTLGATGSNPKQQSEVSSTISTIDPTSTGSGVTAVLSTPPFVTREEINALLVVCRNYKLHFSRKCAERPFENILSILAKYPWHQPHRVLPLHRDHIFELLKLSIESLRTHLSKEYNTIHPTLLTRMVRSAILTPAFTERQKAMVLHVAGCTCPEDIIGWMSPPTPVEAEASDDGKVNIESKDATSEDITHKQVPEEAAEQAQKSTLQLNSEDGCHIDGQIESLGISDETKGTVHSINVTVAQQSTKTSGPPTPSPGDVEINVNNLTESNPAASVADTNDTEPANKPENSLPSSAPQFNVGMATANSAIPASEITTNPGVRNVALAPSYAAAVTKRPANLISNGSQALRTPASPNASDSTPTASSNGTLSSRSSSNEIWKQQPSRNQGQHQHQHHSSRSLSLSNFQEFTAPNALLVTGATKSAESALVDTGNCIDDQRLGNCSLPKLGQQPLIRTKSTLSTALSPATSTQATTPTNTSPLSLSPVIPSIPIHIAPASVASDSAVLAVLEEKTKSESILDAIKTITQSTPRLSKPGSSNQMNSSISGTSLGPVAAAAASTMGGHANRQQRCEGGETL
ncbi:hypothetical protein BGX26_000471 [Mortierella sp. AD094]|nr:hypothetical protein BGX26_000471 [Mortierella sp. AD094]